MNPLPAGLPKRSPRRLILGLAALAVLIIIPVAGYLWIVYVTRNFHVVVEGVVYRSGQPTTGHLEKWHQKHGFRTIINLRGPADGKPYQEEREAARRMGIKLVDIQMDSQKRVPVVAMRNLIAALKSEERPILLHCRAGAERTGVASVISAMLLGKEDYASARSHLSVKYLHMSLSNEDGVVSILKEYEDDCTVRGRTLGGWEEFHGWFERAYREGYYWTDIVVPEEIHASAGGVVEVPAIIRNGTGQPVPLSNPNRRFSLNALDLWVEEIPTSQLGECDLPKEDLPPGAEIRVVVRIQAPSRPGRVRLMWDVQEAGICWFSNHGSPRVENILVVN